MALTAESIVLVSPDRLSSLSDIWGNTLALGLSSSNTSLISISSNNFKYWTLISVVVESYISSLAIGTFQYPPRPIDNSGLPTGYGAFSVSNPLRSFFSNDYGSFSINQPLFFSGGNIQNYSSPLIQYELQNGFSYNPNLEVTAFIANVSSVDYLGFTFSINSPFSNVSSSSIYIVSDNSFIQGTHTLQGGSSTTVITNTLFTSNMSSSTPIARISDYKQTDSNTLLDGLYGFNGTIPYDLYQSGYNWLVVNGSMDNYPLDNTPSTFKFLSNYPNRSNTYCASPTYSCFSNAKRLRVGSYETIDVIIDSSLFSDPTNVYYETYGEDFQIIDSTFGFNLNSFAPVTASGLYKVQLPVGWLNLSSNFAASSAYSLDDIKYMVMYITKDYNVTLRTEFRYFRFDRECTIYEPVEFMFLNKLGGWDYWTFTQDSKETHSISRNEYEQEINWGETRSGLLGTGFRGRNIMSGNVQKTFTANTNWITETEYEFLSELVESPQVYIIKKFQPSLSGYSAVAVIITDTSYEIKTAFRDSIFNLTINYKMAVDTPMQRQ